MEVSNIDDFLTAQQGPRAPEMQPEPASVPEDGPRESVELGGNEPSYDYQDKEENIEVEDDAPKEVEEEAKNVDDYGNPKALPKTYTEDEVNEKINKAIRDRLARGSSAQQATQQSVQQQAKDSGFEYDPDSQENWQQQLERFVENTVSRMGQKQYQQQQQQKEVEADSQFRERFVQGMDRFSDFKDVVGVQPVSDAMTMALRGIKDPAAFIYAASKRNPQELSRISQLSDPYSQIVEMGKLEERMRKSPVATKAPRPLSRTQDDGVAMKKVEKRDDSIEALIAQADNKKRAMLAQRRGGR